MFCALALNKGSHRRWALALSGKKIESWSKICPGSELSQSTSAEHPE